MRQVFRRVIDPAGKVSVEDVPVPTPGPYDVLIAAQYSLISGGTESATLRKTPLALAKQVWADPWMRGNVKEILTSGGLRATADRVLDQLYLPRPVGYSGAGNVIETGAHVDGIRPGMRVAYAACSHAEIVAAARTLVVPFPMRSMIAAPVSSPSAPSAFKACAAVAWSSVMSSWCSGRD
jgi:NADPH:quinone reductase-like Zn-dependent oxidoreductase